MIFSQNIVNLVAFKDIRIEVYQIIPNTCFEYNYYLKLKKSQRKRMEQSSSSDKVGIRWRRKEDIWYHFYLILNYQSMKEDGRKNKVFIDMCKFIPKRSPGQCRSHHQKRIKKNGNSVDLTLSRFYREHYTQRLLDYDHLEKELTFFIQKALENELIDEEKHDTILNIMPSQVQRLRQKENEEEESKSSLIQPQRRSREEPDYLDVFDQDGNFEEKVEKIERKVELHEAGEAEVSKREEEDEALRSNNYLSKRISLQKGEEILDRDIFYEDEESVSP